MGRDKALLPLGPVPLVVHVARVVCEATGGSATLVGPRDRYGSLGWPLIEDQMPGDGPLGGIIAALHTTTAEYNLIVACDMPWLTVNALRDLLAERAKAEADVILARSENGIEPLCAIYRRRCLPVLEAALREGHRAVRRVIAQLHVHEWPVPNPRLVTNANTAQDWAMVEAGG